MGIISSIAIQSIVLAAVAGVCGAIGNYKVDDSIVQFSFLEWELERICASAPASGVCIVQGETGGRAQLSVTWPMVEDPNRNRAVLISLEGRDLVLRDGNSRRLVARGIRNLKCSLSGKLVHVEVEGEKRTWTRDFAMRSE